MHRIERISEDMTACISKIIREDVKHPDIEGIISILKSDVTPDLKYAKVYVSIYGTDDKEKVMKALKKSSGFIRKQVSQRLKIQNTPEIIFTLDNTIEYGAHINELLSKL